MRIAIFGKNLSVSEAVSERVTKKVGKMSRYFEDDVEAQVRLSVEKQRNICEITIPIKGRIIRAEAETGNNLFAAIDEACEKLERQVHRNRTRLEKRLKASAFVSEAPEYAPQAYAEPDIDYGAVVREKRFELENMTVEEAIEQMELLGHTFFLFLNVKTQSVCVVYRRNDGQYGLLLPQSK